MRPPDPVARLVYTVRATFPSVSTHERFLAWLVPDHIEGVKRGGAESATVVILEPEHTGELPQVETHYIFPSREAFAVYEKDHAPALRADGLIHFGPEMGVRFDRRLGDVASNPA